MRDELEREREFVAMPEDYIEELDTRIQRLQSIHEARLHKLRHHREAEQALVEKAHNRARE